VTDRFIDRVSELAGRTKRALDQVAEVLQRVEDEKGAGIEAYIVTLQRIANEHAKIALDCLVETQPLELLRLQPDKRLEKMAEDAREIATDLLTRRIPGDGRVEDAATYLSEAAQVVRQELERRQNKRD